MLLAVLSEGTPRAVNLSALTFAANVSNEFLDRLGHKRQAALVVMAFWCVLMHRVPNMGWYQNAKAKEMLAVLEGLLTQENLDLISWPLQQIQGSEPA